MFGETAYWGVLFLSVALFWLAPRRLRFSLISLISFCYLFSLDGSLYSNEGELLVSALFTRNRTTLYHLAGWALLFYYLPANRGRFKNLSPWLVPGLVLAILAYLAYYKYVPTILLYFSGVPVDENIIIPLGISYFSFKLIHYAIETSRKNIPQHTFDEFLGYIFRPDRTFRSFHQRAGDPY